MINKRPYILTFIYMIVGMIFPLLIWISEQIALPQYIYYNKYYICVFIVSIISAIYYLSRIYKLKKVTYVTYANIWLSIIVIM